MTVAEALVPEYAASSYAEPFAEFCRDYLVQSADVFAGEPLDLEPWQLDYCSEALSYREDGEPVWRLCVLIVARKNGKTQLLAAYALFRLLADQGAPEILLAASSDGQAGRLFEAAERFVNLSPELSEELRVRSYDGLIRRADGNGLIRRVASDPKRLHGFNPSLVIADELAQWTKPTVRDAWTALTTGKAARRQAQTFVISTAGESHERSTGILGQLLDRNQVRGELERPRPGLTVSRDFGARALVYNYSAPTSDPKDVAALKLANPASWVTLDYLEREVAAPEHSDAAVLQYYGCVWAASEDTWLPRAAWADCARPALKVEAGEAIALGFDGSQYEDATALVGSRLSDGHVFLVEVWQKEPGAAGRGWEVPREEVSAAVARACGRYEVVSLYADPPGWWNELRDWQGAYPGVVTAFRTNRPAKMTDACDRFSTAVLAGQLTHDDAPRLTEHVLNARAYKTTSGVMVRKDRPDSPRKIDAAVAAVLAYAARADALERGYGRRRGLVRGF